MKLFFAFLACVSLQMTFTGAAFGADEALSADGFPKEMEFPAPAKSPAKTPVQISAPSKAQGAARGKAAEKAPEATAENAEKGMAEQARQIYSTMLAALIPIFKNPEASGFSVRNCATWNPAELISFFVLDQPLKRTFRFKEQCDLDGELTARMAEPFDLDFKLRHLKEFTRALLRMQLSKKIVIDDQTVHIDIQCQNGHLRMGNGQKDQLRFEGDYHLVFSLRTRQLQDNHGGHLKVTEYQGRPVNVDRDIVIDQRADLTGI